MRRDSSSTHRAQLLDLSPDVILRIVACLPFFERLRLSEVCSRLRTLLAGPSEAWREIEAAVPLDEGEDWPPRAEGPVHTPFQSFCRWLAPRLRGVETLRLGMAAFHPGQEPLGSSLCLPYDILQLCVRGRSSSGVPGSQECEALSVAKLSIEWAGRAALWGRPGVPAPPLPHLRKLAFPAGTELWVRSGAGSIAHGMPSLTDFGLIDGTLRGEVDAPWLPPSLTMLCLAASGLAALPGVLAHLPRLQSLVLDHNFNLGQASFDRLTGLTALQELNLSECSLAALPHQISALSSLRILYLHNTFVDAADLAPAEWAPLGALRRLVFLSISGNSLHAVPPVVQGMTQLRGLHLEDNLITTLPAGAPVLPGLAELLLDWRTALGSPAALAAATRLTRLILNDHLALELGPGPHTDAVDALLGALGALRVLRRIDDVIPEGLQGMVASVSAPVAHAMLRLGRACPAVELGTMPATNAGWTLSALVAGLPHNDGLALLQPAELGQQPAAVGAAGSMLAEAAVEVAPDAAGGEQPPQGE